MDKITLCYYLICVAWYFAFIGMIVYLYYRCKKPYQNEFKEKYYETVPTALNPGELSNLMYKKITSESFTATILILIKKEVLTLKHTEKDYYIASNPLSKVKLSASQKYLVDFIIETIGDKEKVSFSQLREYCNNHSGCSNFLMNYQIWLRMMRKEASKKKFYEEKTDYSKVKAIQTIGFLLILVNLLGGYHLLLGYFMIIPAFFVAFYFYNIYKRTPQANEEYHKWLAFKNFLNEIENFPYDKNQIDTYLIYGVVLKTPGLEQKITKYKYIDDLTDIINHSVAQATLRGDRSLFDK